MNRSICLALKQVGAVSPAVSTLRRFADPTRGRRGTLHGTYSYVLQNADGQIMHTHSISAGLDYAAIGPEHAYLRQSERAHYTLATDEQVMVAFHRLCESEGIIPALESATRHRRSLRARATYAKKMRFCSSTSPAAAIKIWTRS